VALSGISQDIASRAQSAGGFIVDALANCSDILPIKIEGIKCVPNYVLGRWIRTVSDIGLHAAGEIGWQLNGQRVYLRLAFYQSPLEW
jgi:hypothetical protein